MTTGENSTAAVVLLAIAIALVILTPIVRPAIVEPDTQMSPEQWLSDYITWHNGDGSALNPSEEVRTIYYDTLDNYVNDFNENSEGRSLIPVNLSGTEYRGLVFFRVGLQDAHSPYAQVIVIVLALDENGEVQHTDTWLAVEYLEDGTVISGGVEVEE